jgi:prefoldin subunit 5
METINQIRTLVYELERKQRVTIDNIDSINARIDSISDSIREINTLCNDVKSALNEIPPLAPLRTP